ncbi:MAG: hypothetical protein AUJ47_01690 [Candidatus Marinimicrobia bacterium CG1_02_48_14]|nr:MAG: hypothetical protein AUJ47_01690 [Candidatus Marinimicrobia bacterium CG1_02_48_14]PJA54513.1 MAG: hypothetical protein CO167_03400 [Candidatus Marinimicrobia bacterium CG_4_9_14_3_um_filter_48_9]
MAMEWPDETILNAIKSCIEDESIFIVDWTLQNRRGDWQLNLRCDADNGITVDQLAKVNRAIRDGFQLSGLDTELLEIEVGSPGLTFPIKTVRHFKRYSGHQLKIEHDLPAVENPIIGIVDSVEDDAVSVNTGNTSIKIPLINIQAGYVQLKW